MAALLPLLCVAVGAWRLRSTRADGNSFGRRESILAGAVFAGLFATAVAELSSLAHAFERELVLLAWFLYSILLAGTVWLRKRQSHEERAASSFLSATSEEIGLFLGLGALVAAVAVVAGAAAPSNWDSLTYHLPRISHWIQNASVADYPTHVIRQLTLGPGAEFLSAQIQLLGGTDRWINFLQLVAWLGAGIAASLVAQDLGAGRFAQGLAAVFALTLPMAILQASSTQNDLILSFWLLVFVHFALKALAGKAALTAWLLAGASLGLAIETKATALPIAFPFALALFVGGLRRGASRARGPLAAAVLLVMLVNAGYVSRNLALFGSPLGGEHGTVNTAFSPGLTISNLARNASLQLLTPWPSWNARVESAVVTLHHILRVSPSDPRSTWRGAEFHVPAGLARGLPADADLSAYAVFHEDEAGNLIHVLITLACLLILATRRSFPGRARLLVFAGALAAGFFFFSLILKWQPWGARLELPLLLLAAPFAGSVLGQTRAGLWVAALLLLSSSPWALLNAPRQLVGSENVLTIPRFVQSFSAAPGLREPLLGSARAIAARNCRRVGLEIGPDDPEYLIWLALREAGLSRARIEHVGVRNRSSAKAAEPSFASFAPCAILTLAPSGSPAGENEFYAGLWEGGRVGVRSIP